MLNEVVGGNVFIYDDVAHTYTLNGQRLAGVTSILKTAGMIDTEWYDEQGRERGKNVHTACQYLDEGVLDWPVFAERFPALVGYVKAYERFKSDTGFRPILIEKPMYHPGLKYAGTPDRFGAVSRGGLWLPDLKTGRPEPWAGIQTAAYEAMIRLHHQARPHIVGDEPIFRVAVELQETGTWKSHPFTDPADWMVFQSAYNVANWIAQKQNGGKYANG